MSHVTEKLRTNTRLLVDKYGLYESERVLLGMASHVGITPDKDRKVILRRIWAERLFVCKIAIRLYGSLQDEMKDDLALSLMTARYGVFLSSAAGKLEEALRPPFLRGKSEVNQFFHMMQHFDDDITANVVPLRAPPEKLSDYIKV